MDKVHSYYSISFIYSIAKTNKYIAGPVADRCQIILHWNGQSGPDYLGDALASPTTLRKLLIEYFPYEPSTSKNRKSSPPIVPILFEYKLDDDSESQLENARKSLLKKKNTIINQANQSAVSENEENEVESTISDIQSIYISDSNSMQDTTIITDDEDTQNSDGNLIEIHSTSGLFTRKVVFTNSYSQYYFNLFAYIACFF